MHFHKHLSEREQQRKSHKNGLLMEKVTLETPGIPFILDSGSITVLWVDFNTVIENSVWFHSDTFSLS